MCREREAPNTRTAPRRERTRDSTRHRRRTGHARPPQAGRFHSGKPPPGGLPRYRISPWTEDAPSTVPGGVGSTEHMHVHQPRLPPAQGQGEAGPEAIRTWERGHPTERRQVFVVIPPIYPRPHDRAMCSHVHIEGSVHMGACQLVLTDARESRNHAENCTRPSEAPPLPCATFPEAPLTPRQRDRSSCSAGLLNRFRCGIRPISAKWRGTASARSWPAAGSRPARSRLTTPAGRPGRHRDRADGLPPGAAAGFCGRCRPRSRSATRPRPPPGGRER